MQKNIHVQTPYLNELIEKKTLVKIFMINGFQINGIITAYDKFSISVQTDDKQQMIYKQAVSTIVG